MAGMKLTGFAGMAPRISASLLQDNEAQNAVNVKLYSGELRSWKKSKGLAQAQYFTFVPKTIFRSFAPSGDAIWMAWDKDVNVVKGPINDTQEARLYYTGDGIPKKTNSALAVNGSDYYPRDYLALGVPAPVNALSTTVSNKTSNPTIKQAIQSNVAIGDSAEIKRNGATLQTISISRTASDDLSIGGTVLTEYRTYVYTFVSVFGDIEEESAPSPASEILMVRFGQEAILSNFSAPPSGKYNIKYIRIYRAVSGSSTTPYLFVGQIDASTATTFTDTVAAEDLGSQLPSASWSMPPDDLQGLTAMANGILAGFVDNKLYFSEPFMPHAWPFEYIQTTDHKIVGLAAFGESLAVMTEANPYIVTGADPASMSMARMPIYEPCVSKRSIASDNTGVMYASPNGIVLVNTSGAENITRNLFTRNEWQTYSPATMIGAVVDGRYILFYANPSDSRDKGGLVFDRYVQQSPLSLVSAYSTALYVEPTESMLYLAVDQEIQQWEGDAYNAQPYEWKSKEFILSNPVNFGAAQIEALFDSAEEAERLQLLFAEIVQKNKQLFASSTSLGGTLGYAPLNTKAVNGSVLFELGSIVDDRFILLTVYADGKERCRITVKDRGMVRLPSGFKSDRWVFQLNGNMPLKHLKVAETAIGLKAL